MRGTILLAASLLIMGCPESKTPPGGTSATPGTAVATAPGSAEPSAGAGAAPAAPNLKGGWTLHLASESQGINPDTFDTPEKKAKVFWDHAASVKDGKLTIEHNTLKKSWQTAPDKAAELDKLMTTIDWGKMQLRTNLEEAQEGGTIFTFDVKVGDKAVKLKTGNLDAYPDLKKIVEILRATAGVP